MLLLLVVEREKKQPKGNAEITETYLVLLRRNRGNNGIVGGCRVPRDESWGEQRGWRKVKKDSSHE